MTTPLQHTGRRQAALPRLVDLASMAAAGGIGAAIAVLVVGGSPLVILPAGVGGALVGSLVGRLPARWRRR